MADILTAATLIPSAQREGIGLPPIYQLKEPHPMRNPTFIAKLHPEADQTGFRDFVAIVEKTTEFMKHWEKVSKTLKVPVGNGTEDDVADGYLLLQEGDMLWVRDKLGDGDPAKDGVRFFYAGSAIIDSIDKDYTRQMDELKDRVLGPTAMRTNSAPTYEQGQFVGGTHYERTERAIPVKPGVRCYTNANSAQTCRGLVSPTAGLKMTGPELDEQQELRRDINTTFATIIHEVYLKVAPTHISALQEKYGSTLNTHCVGAKTQHIFSNVQVNISTSELFDALVDLARSLGFFGGVHVDNKDDGAFPTGMLFYPTDQPGYTSGRFYIVDFGIAITPKPRDIAFFTGRHHHVGTPSRAPKGANVVSLDAYRLTLVCYPNGNTVRGTAPTSFAPLGHGDGVLQVTPEMRHRFDIDVNRTSLVADGVTIMGPQHFVDTVAREHHLIASSFAALTPTNFRLRVDKNKLMGAFSLHTITEEEDIDTTPAQQLQLTSQDCSDDQAAPIVAEAKAENGVYRPTIWLEGSNNVIDDLPALFEMEKELFHQGSFTPSVFIQTEALRKKLIERGSDRPFGPLFPTNEEVLCNRVQKEEKAAAAAVVKAQQDVLAERPVAESSRKMSKAYELNLEDLADRPPRGEINSKKRLARHHLVVADRKRKRQLSAVEVDEHEEHDNADDEDDQPAKKKPRPKSLNARKTRRRLAPGTKGAVPRKKADRKSATKKAKESARLDEDEELPQALDDEEQSSAATSTSQRMEEDKELLDASDDDAVLAQASERGGDSPLALDEHEQSTEGSEEDKVLPERSDEDEELSQSVEDDGVFTGLPEEDERLPEASEEDEELSQSVEDDGVFTSLPEEDERLPEALEEDEGLPEAQDEGEKLSQPMDEDPQSSEASDLLPEASDEDEELSQSVEHDGVLIGLPEEDKGLEELSQPMDEDPQSSEASDQDEDEDPNQESISTENEMLPQHDAHRSPRGADQDHDNQGQASDEESDVQDTTRAPTEGGMIQYEAPHERPRSTLIATEISKTITLDYLHHELKIITQVVAKLAASKEAEVISTNPVPEYELQQIQDMMTLLGTESHSPDVPASIIAAQAAIREVNKRSELNVALTTASHAHQMLTDTAMWRWLWKTSRQARMSLGQVEDADATSPEWIGTLARFIRGKILLRKGFDIESAQFIPGVVSSITFTFHPKRGDTAYADPAVLQQRSGEVFKAALMKWLSYPTGDAAPYRALFTFFMIHRFASTAVLYLPVTWSTRNKLRATLFDRATDLATVNWNALSYSLSRHALADPTSPEAAILLQIGAKHRELMERSAPVEFDFDLPAISSGQLLLSRFCVFLKEAAATTNPMDPLLLTKLQQTIINDSDKLQPFREHALSRTIVRDHHQSPFSPPELRTRRGFFNALMFRGVTCGAPILTQEQMVHFENADQFMQDRSIHGWTAEFCCNRPALRLFDRYTKTVQGLWTASWGWKSFLASHPTPGFLDLFHFIRFPRPHIGMPRIPGFSSDRICYLLAADYAYAGLVPRPTARDMAHVIHCLQGAGLNGLQLLKLVPLHECQIFHCFHAIEKLIDMTSVSLTEAVVTSTKFDLIALENSLCTLVAMETKIGVLLPM